MAWLIRALARDTSLWADDVWMADSNPRGMRPVSGRRPPQRLGRMRPVRHCASHSRYFYGLRLHLLWTLHGLPVGFALASDRADDRQALLAILHDAELAALLPGQVLIGDKNYYGPRLRDRPGPGRAAPAVPGPPRRARTAQQPVLQAADPLE